MSTPELLADVVSVSIHPGIGIARVGNSRAEHFVGPQIPGVHPIEGASLRDGQGAFKRQAARFRIFGHDSAGQVIAEITDADARIVWSVHLANKKAAWFDFAQAFDIPASKGELGGVRPLASGLRNKHLAGTSRTGLVIDPGVRTIEGAGVNADGRDGRFAFDTGRFLGKPVTLGELRTETDGSLLVLGGFGESAAPGGEAIIDFANNTGWHDDIADGSVDAEVEIDGRRMTALGAWVIVSPPNFAPGIPPLVTGYDIALGVAAEFDGSVLPERPAFGEHVQPLLERFAATQWVNGGFALQFGWGSPLDFSEPTLLERLNDPCDDARPLRRAVFALFRDPGYATFQADRVPAVYGDAILLDPKTHDPREWMAILPFQHAWLRRWAEGDFEPGLRAPAREWSALDPAERARGLDRAALEDCSGGPFHPGIEFTWPLRHRSMYEAPFRLKRRELPETEGLAELTSSTALAPGGPIDGSNPGDVTRWMAVPWQTDTGSCLSAYEDYAGEYLPTFWPARVPNDVLSAPEYAQVMDASLPLQAREEAFAVARRRKWLRGYIYKQSGIDKLPFSYGNLQRFVETWPRIGVVERRSGPDDTPALPDVVWVDDGPVDDGVGDLAAAAASPASDASATADRRDPATAIGSRRRSRLQP